MRESEIGTREADKLVKVWRGDGAEIWVLIHIEVQSQAQSEFAERMYVYHNRIFDRYRRPVVSLAVLADDQENWRPDRYTAELWGCQVQLRFPVAKLLDYQNKSLEQNPNPFAVIVAAHLTTQQTRQDPQGRYQSKLRIAKSLYQRGYSRQDILELFRLIDWIIALPYRIEKEFHEEIQRFEEESRMRYVTSIERFARQDGVLQERRDNVIDVLTVRFQEVPQSLVEAIDVLEDPDQLKTLLRQAITIGSLSDFQGIVETLGDAFD